MRGGRQENMDEPSEMVRAVVSADEARQLRELADEAKRSLSSYLRIALQQHLKEVDP